MIRHDHDSFDVPAHTAYKIIDEGVSLDDGFLLTFKCEKAKLQLLKL